MSEEKEPLSEAAYQSGLRQFTKAIEDAQTRCDSRGADHIYAKQLAWMDKVRPEPEPGIVNGRDRVY